MTKTQIQVPEEQMKRIREFARRREWSLAETFRRGVEMLMDRYGSETDPVDGPWRPPTLSRPRGWQGLSDEEIKQALLDEATERHQLHLAE